MASSSPRTRTAAALCEDSTFRDTNFIGRSNDEAQNDQHQQHRPSPLDIISYHRQQGRDDDARPRYNNSNRNRRWSIETSSTISSTSSEQEQEEEEEDIGDDDCCTEAEGASMMVILPQRTNRRSGHRWREDNPRRHYSGDGDNDRAKMTKANDRSSANHNGRRSRHSGHGEYSEDYYYQKDYNRCSGNRKQQQQQQRHLNRSSDPMKPERNRRRRSSCDGSAAVGWTSSSSSSSRRGSSHKKKHHGVVDDDDNGTIVSGLTFAAIRMLRGRDALKMFILAAMALASAQFYYSIHNNLFISTTVNNVDGTRRFLSTSLDLGGGDCLWQPPIYDVPEQMDFHKTLIAGYPSGDKRMVWLQMEALAGWPAKDEWDFAYIGMSNHPFIKANYPHHEGYWGWEDVADQVVLMVPYIRRSMVEYHDVLWDLEFPTTWGHPAIRQELLYMEATPTDSWYDWRDMRILDECHWFGWFIDYWMEGGLLRDIFTHERINLAHWNELMLRPFGTREQLSYEKWSSRHGVATRDYYDPHCEDNDISEGCEPVEVVSVDRLVDATRGPVETEKIATALLRDSRTGDHVIAQQAWDCIWEEMIVHRKGPKTIYDRPGKGYVASDNEHNFSEEMLKEMLTELNRLITKYSGSKWSSKPTANILVELLMEHVFYLQMEINEVKSGARKLSDKAFLGPKTRENRRRLVVSSEEKEETTGAAKKQKNETSDEEDGVADDNEDPDKKKQMEDNLERLNQVGQLEFLKKRQSAKKARGKDRPRTKQV